MYTDYSNRKINSKNESLTYEEIQKEYGIPYPTLQHWKREGKIQEVPSLGRFIRISRKSLEAHLESRKRK